MISTLAGLVKTARIRRRAGDAKATLAPILKREDGLIDFSRTATENLEPASWISAVAWGVHHISRQDRASACGRTGCPRSLPSRPRISQSKTDRLLLGFAHGTALEVLELQVEGKKRMSARDFINGYRPRSDEPLGAPA